MKGFIWQILIDHLLQAKQLGETHGDKKKQDAKLNGVYS
jgi:hypothetical protein